nr:hypothetical protein [Candidatus Brocadiales bacterium]
SKPTSTTFNRTVTVTSAYRQQITATLHPYTEVGANPDGRIVIPSEVSHPGHFDTAPHGTALTTYL